MTTCDTATIFETVAVLCGCAGMIGLTLAFLTLGYQILTAK